MQPLPDGLTPYKQTPEFTESTVPAGLLRDHKLSPDVWGVIHVVSGRLRYVIPSTQEDLVLEPGLNGVVMPDTAHHIASVGPVRFYVEFWRADSG